MEVAKRMLMYISVRFVLQLTKLYLGELKHITKKR